MIVLTVKRPNGKTEKVETKFGGMTDVLFKKIQEANAGKGDVLSWENVDTRTDAEKADHDLNDKIAKTEIELARARELDPQSACILRDKLESLKDQKKG